MNITVIIDVFRAFTTASYVLAQSPKNYFLTTSQEVILQLMSRTNAHIVIGKNEEGTDNQIYDIPNSPTRVLDVEIFNRNILHRTNGGATGILAAKNKNLVLAAGFVNASATVNFIKKHALATIDIIPMGHEGKTPSLEDDLCAKYIEKTLKGENLDITPYISALKEQAGKYFFSEDQWQYPRSDFERCLEIDRFNFAIKAKIQDNYAILTACN
jgi:2-phosphosulfolactate phosphatase